MRSLSKSNLKDSFRADSVERQSARRDKIGTELYNEIHRLRDTLPSKEAKLYQLIARGGEHLVFEVKKSEESQGVRDVVVKLNMERTMGSLLYALEHPNKEDARTPLLERERSTYIEDLKTLRRYFGQNAVLPERVFLRTIPFSQKALEGFFPQKRAPLQIPDTITAWISVQKRLDRMSPEAIRLEWYYPEAPSEENGSSIQERDYAIAHDVLVGRLPSTNLEQGNGAQEKRACVFRMYPTLASIHDRMQQDPSLRRAIQDFVHKSMIYTRETGKILDLIGEENAYLIPSDDDWNLRLPDALSAAPGNEFTIVEQVADQLAAGSPIDEHLLRRVRNGLNALRYVNALALLAGSSEQVVFDSLKKVSPEKWYNEFRTLNVKAIL